ncbi:MAG: amidohydrolase family protein, partial [Quisquiliibacterium sp.]
LEAITLAGARALGLGQAIGSIEPGKLADLAAFELSGPELSPVFDPVSHLIYAAGREHLREVWIDGQHVVHKRQLLGAGRNAKLSEVTARSRLWHNRIHHLLPPD